MFQTFPTSFRGTFPPCVVYTAGSMNFALSLSRRALSLAKIDLSTRPLGQSPHTQPSRWARALFIFQMVSRARFFASRWRVGTPRRSCRLLESRLGSLRMSFLPANFAIIPPARPLRPPTYVHNVCMYLMLSGGGNTSSSYLVNV
jgi:hypothetical protein